MTKVTYPKPEHYNDTAIPAFGYELLRDALLPELLGEELSSILYWSGRKLARQYPLDTIDDIQAFFEYAAWGQLSVISQQKDKIIFDLTSELVEARMKDNPNASFSLEAGFLAEQLQRQLNCTAEAFAEPKNRKAKHVTFHVKWDFKDMVIPIKKTHENAKA
ncbi:putative hydrocarbon binding protein [Scopulibacillus daqui]|uniref:Hydrocarbon binding protein n=1 Tax=Scopulibacillus daqui TaxID=1469162 RepID=A0ABS2PXS7_9BACL|nr:YslB family protein [Scopulibacillus daqui]MBM7644753.1 putative hydrocarbon binding protein [Scopulibacillus daqui]